MLVAVECGYCDGGMLVRAYVDGAHVWVHGSVHADDCRLLHGWRS